MDNLTPTLFQYCTSMKNKLYGFIETFLRNPNEKHITNEEKHPIQVGISASTHINLDSTNLMKFETYCENNINVATKSGVIGSIIELRYYQVFI